MAYNPSNLENSPPSAARPASVPPASYRRELAKVQGGQVGCGSNGASLGAAFTYIAPTSMPLPIVIAVPHAGRAYPPSVLANMRDEELGQLRLEDRHVDALGVEIAKATGAGLLVAHAPRAMLDLNRAPEDVDWDMIAGAKRDPARRKSHYGSHTAGAHSGGINRRARSGLGLVPRRLPGFGEIWRQQIDRPELDRRIDCIHRPYHEFLSKELQRIRDIWGAALLIDLHSMPPLRAPVGHDAAPQIVLGDRFGASCHHVFIARAMRYLEERGIAAAHNRPYSGGYVLDRHASPTRGLHAVQVEVCRSAYLDTRLSELTGAMKPLAAKLAGLARELGGEAARLGGEGQARQAAE